MELSLFLTHQFPRSSFQGRLQLGCRSGSGFGILPVFTCDYGSLFTYLETFHFFPWVDYYLSVNSVSGVRRQVFDLFSLHNLVIDIDCHGDLVSFFREERIDCLIARLEHSVFEVEVPCPSSVVKTGRGVQFWWSITGISVKFKTFYDELLDYYISCISGVLTNGFLEDFSMFEVDVGASKNAVGYFRLPCTMNTKTNTLVTYRIVAGTYELMDLFEQMKEHLASSPEDLRQISAGKEKNNLSFGRDYVDLANERVDMFYNLREMREASIGLEERNNFCFMVYNALAPCYGHDVAFAKMKQFNTGFLEPMTIRELNVVVCSAKEKGGYQYTTNKIVEFLHISQVEAAMLGMTKSDPAYLTKRKQKQVLNMTKKDLRNESVLALYDSGSTAQTIASELNLSINTVRKVLTEHGRSHKMSRKEQILALKNEGKSLAEIAKLCDCSVKTVRRDLLP